MKRNTALKILNPVLGLLVLSQAASGLGHGALSHDVFEVVHEGGGVLLVLAAAAHLALNWNWVRASYSARTSAPQN